MDLRSFRTKAYRSSKMPVLFVGHGSPMNALEENHFVENWRSVRNGIEKPNAIIVISAHWETNGTMVTAMEKPRTIHDFYGFPQQLFNVQYPAIGDPQVAHFTKESIESTSVGFDHEWGLDHGTWSVLKHMYPAADVPVLQLSIDRSASMSQHYRIARELHALRNYGILIMGSGNMVHNLSKMDWRSPDIGYDWAEEANLSMKNLISAREHKKLLDYQNLGLAFQLSIPTPEHYIPLIYILGASDEKDKLKYFNDLTVYGSISMTSLIFH